MSLLTHTFPVPLHLDKDEVIRVGGTRLTLDTVIGAFQDGCSAEEIVLRYDSLRLADVYLTIGYYLDHRQEVDEYLRRREDEAAEVRRQIEARCGDMSGIRERLLARRAQQRGQS